MEAGHGRISRASGLAAALLGTSVLFGWLLGVDALKSVFPGLATMKFNTALGFLLLGAATYLAARRPGTPRAVLGLAGAAVVLAGVTLGQDVVGFDTGLDTLFVDDPDSAFTPDPGRMSPATATGFLLAGAGLLAVHSRWARRRLEQWTSVLVAAIALSALGGYLFEATPFYGATLFTAGMAVHTALGFLVLAVGAVSLRPDQGWVAAFLHPGYAGQTARLLIPTILIVPVLAAIAASFGIRLGWWDSGFALSLELVADIAILAAVTTWGLKRLGKTEQEREEALRRLEHLNLELERRVAQRTHALEEERSRFFTLAESAPVGIFHTDAEGHCDYTNHVWRRLTGRTAAEALGDGWSTAIHQDDRADVLAAWADAAERAEPFRMTFRFQRPDGVVRWTSARASAVRDDDGNVTGYVGTNEDVTERRRLEEDLRATVQLRDAIFDASPDHIYVYRPDLRYTFANRAGPAALGLTPDDVVGKHWRDLGFPPEVMEPFEKQVRAVFETGERRVARTSFPLPDGEGWFEYALAPIRAVDGSVARVVAVTRDITERVRNEAAALEATRREAVVERLSAEASFKTDFLNRAAHELSTPLTPIVLQLEVLRRNAADLPESARRSIELVKRNVRRLQTLTKDLLSAARLQSATWSVEPQDADAAALLHDAEADHRLAFKQKGVALTVDAGSVAFRADPEHVRQVLRIFLENALKFTEPGGTVRLGARREGDRVRVEVQDDGIGMEPGAAEKLFTPFSQAHDPMQITALGGGLGLYIAKGIVEAHGGDIHLESDGLGRGTTAWFTLPLNVASRTRPARRPLRGGMAHRVAVRARR